MSRARQPRRRAPGVAALLLWSVLGEGGAGAGTYLVRGADEATFLVPAGVRVEPYENFGYRLEVEESTARIQVDAGPLGSLQPFQLARIPPSRGAAAQLARAVAADATTRFEAASRILEWVAANLRYDLDRTLPQDAESVLARRTAYCTGVARLTVALLDALAIPAREVAGFVVGGEPGAGRTGFHRWVEIFYDDRGWVFADPLASHHLVPASYLRLASTTMEADLPGPALLLSRREGLEMVDLKSIAPVGRVMARPNGEERYAAVVRVTSDVRSPAAATLEGSGRRWRVDFVGGAATFFGVPPAAYALRIWSVGRLVGEQELELDGPRWTEVNIAIGEALSARTGETR